MNKKVLIIAGAALFAVFAGLSVYNTVKAIKESKANGTWS